MPVRGTLVELSTVCGRCEHARWLHLDHACGGYADDGVGQGRACTCTSFLSSSASAALAEDEARCVSCGHTRPTHEADGCAALLLDQFGNVTSVGCPCAGWTATRDRRGGGGEPERRRGGK